MTTPNPITRTMAEEIAKEVITAKYRVFIIDIEEFQAALNLAVQRAVGEPIEYQWYEEPYEKWEFITKPTYEYAVMTGHCKTRVLYALANTEGE